MAKEALTYWEINRLRRICILWYVLYSVLVLSLTKWLLWRVYSAQLSSFTHEFLLKLYFTPTPNILIKLKFGVMIILAEQHQFSMV